MNKKGFSWVGLIVFLAAALAIAAVVFLIVRHGDGNGNDGTHSAVEAMAPVAPDVKELEYIEITIRGNEYKYEGDTIELEEIKGILDDHESLSSVMIVDDGASEKAYRKIEEYLKDNNIQIAHKGENEE